MPYAVVEQDGRYCVYKIDENDEPTGDTLGCHDTAEEAGKQIGAIEASEAAQTAPDAEKSAVKEGRVLSEKNRNLIAAAIAQSKEAITALQDLLSATGPQEEKRAIVDSLRSVRTLAEDDDTLTVGGYGVVFGGKDLYDTYFTKTTDLWVGKFGERLPVFYDHGFDPKLGRTVIGAQKEHQFDDIGLWIAAQLNKHNEYMEGIQELLEKGVLGWSSGSIQHLVDMDMDTGEIRSWPIVEYSLTPTPAEPRTLGVGELRKMVDAVPALGPMLPKDTSKAAKADSGVSASGAGTAKPIVEKPTTTDNTRSTNMAENETTQGVALDYDLLAAALVQQAGPDKLGLTVPAKPKEQEGFKNIGDFLQAVRRSTGYAAQIDPRLAAIRATGMSEGVAADGGFLLQPTYANELLKRVYEVGPITRLCSRLPLGSNSNSVKVPYINETSRANGSRWGGVTGYWLEEAGTKTASKPSLGQIELTLKKVIALMYATDELLEDASMLSAIVNEAFPQELAFMVEDAIINGTGAGTPLGILNAACTVSVAKETGQAAATIVYENVVKMWSRLWARSRPKAVWLINQDCEPQLHTMSLAVGTGGVPVYMPAGGLSGQPYSTLFGRPVMPVEYCQTLGTVGDIILADFSEYATIDKGGVKSDSSIHVNFVYDETAFRWVYRVDGQPKWASALTPKNSTNTLSPFVTLATRA